jgi:type II secretory pathway pseudopilin PulG
MTLIELIAAFTIFIGATLGMALFAARFAHATGENQARDTAVQLAIDRLEDVKDAPLYANIEASYARTESPVAGFPGYTRQTLVQHVGGGSSDLVDYKVITVIVNGPGLPGPIRKTTIISNF